MPPQTPNPIEHKPKDFFPPKIFIILILLAGILCSYQVFYSIKSGDVFEKVENVEVKNELVATDNSNWKTYRNEEYGFEFKYQSELFITDSVISDCFRYSKDEFNQFCIFFYENVPLDESVDQWVSKRQFIQAEPIKLSVDGGVIWKWYEGHDEDMVITSLSIFKDSKVVTFVVPATSRVDQILSTFKFIESKTSVSLDDQIRNIKVGDMLGGLKVVSVEQLLKREDMGIWIDNAKVGFSGEMILSGEWEHYRSDEAFVGGSVCFTVPKGTKDYGRLPLTSTEGTLNWFCFSNTKKATELLGPEGSVGQATVVINNYVSKHCGCEANNEAELVKIIYKEN